MSKYLLRIGLCCPLVVAIVVWPHVSMTMQCGLLFLAALCLFGACSLLLVNWSFPATSTRSTVVVAPPSCTITVTPSPLTHRYGLARIPRTVDELRVVLDPTRFELFASAVVVALGEGHRFHEHRGKSGDRGIDAVVLNLYFQQVGVQCKLYGANTTVGGPALREFWGALMQHSLVYGFFITTSTLTPEAYQVVKDARPGQIRVIDATRLNWLLQWKAHEIEVALLDILDTQLEQP